MTQLRFHHVQLYVDKLQPLSVYREQSCDSDLITHLMNGLGMQITALSSSDLCKGTSILLESQGEHGCQIVVTGRDGNVCSGNCQYDHFCVRHIDRFMAHFSGRQGIAVLAFEVNEGGVRTILDQYRKYHPTLLMDSTSPMFYKEGVIIAEVYAYYARDGKCADRGTILRFLESGTTAHSGETLILPGFKRLESKISSRKQGDSPVCYFDHWVSNTFHRDLFIQTLEDVIGFQPKVDFNAGIVSAGEAHIESTVVGNNIDLIDSELPNSMKQHSQIYLPINNSITKFGHVHSFLEELGQGVQHIALRVDDLIGVVQRMNNMNRENSCTLSFLSIPRSYYGRLTQESLLNETNICASTADNVMQALRQASLLDKNGFVDLDASLEIVSLALCDITESDAVLVTVLQSRYSELYRLLNDYFTEEEYLQIVRNQILVDIQGEDVLLQIFTKRILQRNSTDEAPFIELIQRKCGKRDDGTPVPVGCGGFGIRNFLALFLSIEVTKSMNALNIAVDNSDDSAALIAQSQIDALTAQLVESSPVLTSIAHAMNGEGRALHNGDIVGAAEWACVKAQRCAALQAISSKYESVLKFINQGTNITCPVKLQQIHHVAYRCMDAKATADFYRQSLGMELLVCISEDKVPSTGEPNPYMHIFLDAGMGNILAFFELPESPVMDVPVCGPSTPNWVQHIAFQVESDAMLEDAKSHIESLSVEVLGPTDHGIIRSIYFFDPNGHRIELTTITGNTEQHRLLKEVAPEMLEEWSCCRKTLRTTHWLHEKLNED